MFKVGIGAMEPLNKLSSSFMQLHIFHFGIPLDNYHPAYNTCYCIKYLGLCFVGIYMTTEIGSQEGIGTGIEIKARLVVNRLGTVMFDLLQGQYRHFLNIPRAVKSFGLAILRTGLPNSPPLGFSIQFNPNF